MKKVGRVWPGNTTITNYRPTHCTARKRQIALQSRDIKSNFLATISLSFFPSEMIAKLEMTLSTAQQNRDQIQK